MARRLAAFTGNQIVLGAIALPNLDGDDQIVTVRMNGAAADPFDQAFVIAKVKRCGPGPPNGREP